MFAVAKLNAFMTAPASLKAWRAAKGITQTAAGKLVEVSPATWCDWENGKKIPRVDKAEDLEAITGRAVRVGDWAEYARTETVERQRRRDEGAEHG